MTKTARSFFFTFFILLALAAFATPESAKAEDTQTKFSETEFDMLGITRISNERSTVCASNYRGRLRHCLLYYYRYVGQYCQCRDRETGNFYDGTVVPQ